VKERERGGERVREGEIEGERYRVRREREKNLCYLDGERERSFSKLWFFVHHD